MELSVKEISESLGVNRNKVYRAIEKLSLEPIMVDGVAKYGEDALQAIRGEVERIDQKKRSHGAPHGEPPRSEARDSRVELIEALQVTIKSQEATIEHLRKENDELREMLKREQEIRYGKLVIEASTKPKLTDRIKRIFGHKSPTPSQVNDEPFSPEDEQI